MNTVHFTTLLLLACVAQGASAATIWLKDNSGNVCKNSASTNAGQVIGLGSVNKATGALTLTISNPANGTKTPNSGQCLNLPSAPAANPLLFSGTVVPQILAVRMWKPGTKGAMECLDQGNNFSGIAGSLISGTLTSSFSGSYTDGCNMQTQTKITSDGLPVFTRGAVIGPTPPGRGTIFTGSYYIYNDANPVPEPGSLMLFVAGLAGLVLLGARHRKWVQQTS